jgi:hypothetical protein
MSVHDILGIDVQIGRVHVVEVSRGGEPVVARARTAELPADADAAEVAAVLRRLRAEGGLRARRAVIGLPAGRGFVQCHGGAGGLEALAETHYVRDTWTGASGWRVTGVAARADVTRALEIAAQADLEPVGVELWAMGCLTALGLLEAPAEGAPLLGLVLGEREVFGALAAGGVPLAVHHRPLPPAEGALERRQAVLEAAQRVVRTLRLARPEGQDATREARAIAREADRALLADLSERLGAAVMAVRPGQARGLHVGAQASFDAAAHAAAVGLALEGLDHSGRRRGAPGLNFLAPQQARRPRRRLRWRHAAVAAAAVLLAAAVALGVHGWRRHAALTVLQEEADELAPRVAAARQAARQWRTVRRWVSPASGGRRAEAWRLYREVAAQFPALDEAYWRELHLQSPSEGSGPPELRLIGQVRARDVPIDAVRRLNASPRFTRARVVDVQDRPDEAGYPKQFIITFALAEEP